MKSNRPIELVIKDRLNLQTVKKDLESIGINPSYNYIINNNFIKYSYMTWPKEKKEQFLKTIGGPVFLKKTEQFYNNLSK